MDEEKQKILNSVKIPLVLLGLMWVIKIIETITGISFASYGLFPRASDGLIGVLTFPLLHGSWDHLMSNSLPMLFLLTGLYYFYPQSSKKVFVVLYFVPGVLLWLFGRSVYHIGASGLIYALAAHIFFSGIFKRDKRSIVLALLVTFLYGGMIWGVLPIKQGISWEGHLFGGISGLITALIFKNYDKYKKYDWEDEEEDDYDVRDLEVSYKKGYPFE